MGSLNNPVYRGFTKNQYIERLGQFADLRGGALYYLALDKLPIITYDVVRS